MKRLLALVMALMLCTTMTACRKSKPDDSSSNSSVFDLIPDQIEDEDGDGIADETITASDENNSSTTQSTTQSTTNNSGAGTDSKGSNPLSGVDLGGREIVIYTPYENGIFNTKKGLSTYQDACVSRLATLQTKLNCKIKVVVKSVEDISNLAYTTISSGTKFADIIETPIYQSSAFLSSGDVVNLNSISTLDLTQSYLNAGNAVSASTFYGKSYFVSCEDMIADTPMGYFFNKRILNECGLENPYTLVNNNQWTISKLREMAKAATKDKDGKSGMTKDDQWGIIQTSYTADAAAAVLAVNGAEMIKKDNSGGAVYNMNSSAVLNAISLSTQMFLSDGTAYSKTDGDSDLWNMFMTGHGLFLGCGVNIAKQIMDMDDDFGFVPFPRGDSASSITNNTNWNSSVLMIPKNPQGSNYSDAGYFLQAFTYLSQNTTTAKYKEYSSRYFRDDDSSTMLKKAVQTQSITASSILGSTGDWGIHEGTYKILYNCVSGEKSAKSEIETYQPFSIANLAEYMYKLQNF